MRRTLVLFAVAASAHFFPVAAPAETAPAKPKHSLQSGRAAGAVDRIEALLEIAGEVLKEVPQAQPQPMKMSVVCKVSYDEKTLDASAGAATCQRAIRHYKSASATIKVEDHELKPTLRPERRLIGVEVDLPGVTLFSPQGTLTREELELIDVLGNRLLLDRLLPDRPVAVGEKWDHDESLLAALLGLERVTQSNVHSELKELSDTVARMELGGEVEGRQGGARVQIELKAKYRFDRRSRRIDWLGMLVKDKRTPDPVMMGTDMVARLQVKISPQADAPELGSAALKDLPLTPSEALRQVLYLPPDAGWELTHERRWHVRDEHRDLTVLRMMDEGAQLAQCNISLLPKLAPGTQVPLEKFQEDVQTALGENFGEFIEAGQSGTERNYQISRVVVHSKVADVPIEWRYYLVLDAQGRRGVFAFTLQADATQRFGQADEKLVRGLRFVDAKVADARGK